MAMPQTISETVSCPNGRQFTITTPRGDGEDTTSWLQRHQDAVTAAKRDLCG
jgi:hypothetical protein